MKSSTPRIWALLVGMGLIIVGSAYLLRPAPAGTQAPASPSPNPGSAGSPPGRNPPNQVQVDLQRMAKRAANETVVLATIYPWYGTPWGPRASWQHWEDFGHNPDATDSTGRRDIAAADYPVGGPYDSLDPKVMRRQFDTARALGIDVLLVSWWGPGTPEDHALQVLLNFSHAYGPSPKLGIFMESLGIQTAGGSGAIRSSLLYALEKYSSDPAILHVDGAPLVYLYTTYRVDDGVWSSVLQEAWGRGLRAFLLGDALFYPQAQWLAGVGVYNAAEFAYKGFPLDQYYRSGTAFAAGRGIMFYGTVTPGYDDRPTHRPTAFAVARGDGAFYNTTWQASLRARAPWVMITSFNEWHEATEIEPSVEYGHFYEDLTSMWVQRLKAGSSPPTSAVLTGDDPRVPMVALPVRGPSAWSSVVMLATSPERNIWATRRGLGER